MTQSDDKRGMVRITVSHKTWARLCQAALGMSVFGFIKEKEGTGLTKTPQGVMFYIPVERGLDLLRMGPTHEDGLIKLLETFEQEQAAYALKHNKGFVN